MPPSDPSRFRQSLLSRLRAVSIERGMPSQTIQLRLAIEAAVAGVIFSRFHLDLGIGDPADDGAEALVGDDLLRFASVPPATALVITCPQQFAEKLHAFTFPWIDRANTRVKDLVDLVLLIERANMPPGAVARCVRRTFDVRRTHPTPTELPEPPAGWHEEFARMATEARLASENIGDAFAALAEYWERVRREESR